MNDYLMIILAFITSFILCFIFCKFHLKKINSTPKDQIEVIALNPLHKFKSCGGIDFLLATSISFIIFNFNNFNKVIIILLFTMFYYGLIGFIDDFIKIKKQNNKGLSIFLRIILEIIGVIILCNLLSIHLIEFVKIKNNYLYIGSFALIYMIICVLGCCNGLNLTDGLDGLATITYILTIIPFFYISILQGNKTITIFLVCLIASLLSYLLFNFNPSKLIMGDVGSLSLGAILAVVAISLNAEYLILISGLVYVIEALSVIIQVLFFKISKGKRIFKMAPLHYHFIKSGMKDSNVVLMFTVFSIICSFIATIIGVIL